VDRDDEGASHAETGRRSAERSASAIGQRLALNELDVATSMKSS